MFFFSSRTPIFSFTYVHYFFLSTKQKNRVVILRSDPDSIFLDGCNRIRIRSIPSWIRYCCLIHLWFQHVDILRKKKKKFSKKKVEQSARRKISYSYCMKWGKTSWTYSILSESSTLSLNHKNIFLIAGCCCLPCNHREVGNMGLW